MLSSSAIGSRKVAPKAPRPRRAPTKPAAPEPSVEAAAQNVDTELPSTEQQTVQSHTKNNEVARRDSIQHGTSEQDVNHEAATQHAKSQQAVARAAEAASGVRQQDQNEHVTSRSAAQQAVSTNAVVSSEQELEQSQVNGTTTTRPTRKRGREAANEEHAQPIKRSKRSTRAQAYPSPEVAQAEPTQEQSTSDVTAKSTRRRQPTRSPQQNVETTPRTQDEPRQLATPATTQASQRPDLEQALELNAQVSAPVRASRPRYPRKKRDNTRASEDTGEQQDPAQENLEPDVESDEDPEQHKVDTAKLSMYDVSRDTRHGQTSEREKKMAKIDWTEVARKRHEEADRIARGEAEPTEPAANAIPSTETADILEEGAELNAEEAEQANGNEESERPGPMTRASDSYVRFRVVGGTIVEDETSLTIDRAARVAQAAADTADEPVEEINDLTVRINRTTYINARRRDEKDRVPLWKAKSDAWSEADTDTFYDALSRFGTDFFIISKMFPSKTRKQIKLKFNREERLEPDRINKAMLGIRTTTMNIDEYARAIDRDVNDFHKYDGLAHANEVIKESMKDKEEEMRAAVKEEEENNRQREVQRQQREKQRIEAEKKKEERARKKAAKRRGEVWGAGTFGAADDDDDEQA